MLWWRARTGRHCCERRPPDRMGASNLRSSAPRITVPLALWAMMGVFVMVFQGLAWLRHMSFQEGDYDLGIVIASLHSAAFQGLPLFNTYENLPHFAVHCSPVYLLLLPFYRLWPGAFTVTLLQTLALALGAIPAWQLGRDLVGPRSGMYLAAAYLLYFPMHGVCYHDVHEAAFAVAPFLLCFWGFATRRRFAGWSGALTVLLTREDMGALLVVLGGLSLAIAARDRSRADDASSLPAWPARADAWGLIIMGAAGSAFATGIVMPAYGGGGHLFAYRFAHLGDSVGAVALSPLLRPTVFWSQLLSGPSLSYMAGLVAPLAFLPLYDPRPLIVGLPVLAINLLSSFGGMHLFDSHYAAPLIAPVFAAAAFGCRRRALAETAASGTAGLDALDAAGVRRLRPALVLSVVAVLLVDPTPLHLGKRWPAIDAHARLLDEIVASLPQGVSVSTQGNLWTHMGDRTDAYVGYRDGVDAILIDPSTPAFVREARLDETLPARVREGAYVLEREWGSVQLYRRRDRAPIMPAPVHSPRETGVSPPSPGRSARP